MGLSILISSFCYSVKLVLHVLVMPCAILSKLPSFCDDYNLKSPLLVKIAVVAVTGVGLHYALKVYKKSARNRRRKGYKKDTVILHQVEPALTVPSMSPYALKLVTYLRVAKIPYENDVLEPFGPKGKCPWITYNGVDVADSAFCIQFLNEKFSIDLNANLGPSERAVARCMASTAENNFILCLAMWRCLYDKDMLAFKLMPAFPTFIKMFPFIMRRHFRKFGRIVGIGRHTEQEVCAIGIKDLKAFSDYLGKNQYFLGDKVSEVDSTMFAVLAQCVWALPKSPFEHIMNGELSNLKEFCIRMRDEFWPDWDNALYKK